jgi:hypothetical protein
VLVSGRAWQEDKLRFGLCHHVKAHDVTLGPNGWHPHLHTVLLSGQASALEELDLLTTRLFDRWANAIVQQGSRRPSREHGISLEQARSRSDISRYVCQVVAGEGEHPTPVALEVVRGDLKTSHNAGHRTPWQVLADFSSSGECKHLTPWREWEKATRGIHAIRWSKGLRNEVGLADELTDDELMAIEIGGEVVFTFSRLQWTVLTRRRGGMVQVLERAESGGALAVSQFVAVLVAEHRDHLPST